MFNNSFDFIGKTTLLNGDILAVEALNTKGLYEIFEIKSIIL